MASDTALAVGRSSGPGVGVVMLLQDEVILEKMRLEALTDAPDAFVATVDQERTQRSDHWEEELHGAVWVVVQHGGKIIGIAALKAPAADEPPECRFVESVWVEPDHRGRGVSRQMLTDLERRARRQGACELRLWVLDTNGSAEAAYQSLGFEHVPNEVQDTKKRRPDETFVQERLMSKKLG